MKAHLHITMELPEETRLKVPQDINIIFGTDCYAYKGILVGALFAEYDMCLECAEYEKGDYGD
jgi:hypothetical protein